MLRSLQGTEAGPWYQEPWPWILMALPLSAVAGSLAAAWVAFSHTDPMVVDNYYKEGLAINQVLDRDRRAGQLAYEAQVTLPAGSGSVRVDLGGQGVLPAAMTLTLVHPGDPAKDRHIQLAAVRPGHYEGPAELPAAARWHLQLDDGSQAWRLVGDWVPARGNLIALRPLR